ncbi:putative membrane protein EpsK [Acetobacterium wieringae]|uniref:Putative membrane protein EpsK n=2 Tax=Acetobacterium wieringae TaxID=52694 RepID=A0A1F2PJ31_9FIRM|nr:putative membrane protein EpsK [Acetobacterium wieringae]
MVISIAINFFLSPYIVSQLGTEANGFTQLANNFVMYATLITVALNSMAGRFIAIEYHRGKPKEAKAYYSSVIVGNILILALLILPSVVIITNLDKIINISVEHIYDVKMLFAFVFLNFYVSQVTGILAINMYVANKLFITNLINLVRTIFNGLLLICIFSFFKPFMYYVSLIAFLLTLATVPFLLFYKKKNLSDLVFDPHLFRVKYLIDLVTSGMWNTVNQGGNILMTGLDLLLANIFINPVQMGLLAIAKIIPNTILQIASTINTSFSPNLTMSYAKNDTTLFVKQVRASMKISSILITLPTIIFLVYGHKFYSLWMPTLNSKTLTMLSFLTIMAFIPLAGTQVLYNIFTTTNKLKLNSITFLISGVLNLISVVWLLKFTNLGVFAVAGVSSTITLLRNLLFVIPYTAKIVGLKWYEFYKDVGISLFSSAIIGSISFLIKVLLPKDSWLSLFVAISASILTCFIVSIYIVLNRIEREKILSMLLRKEVHNGQN